MHLRLHVPFRDAAAGDLAWSLLPGAAAPAALARLDVPAAAGPGSADARVRLHVLGASHAVELAFPDGRRLTEVVAYGAPAGRALTAAPAEVVRDGLRYRFSSAVDERTPEAVADLAAELRGALEGAPGALLAAFPGAPGAATALRAVDVPGGAGWETWHLYPERGEVVTTRTSVVPVAAGVG